MTLWPRSLWGQTLASTIAAVLVGQVVVLLLFSLLIVRPELQRAARAAAVNVADVAETLSNAPPEQRAFLLRHLTRTGEVELWQGGNPPDDSGPEPRLRDHIFMQTLADSLDHQAELHWSTDRHRRLWLRIDLGPEPYWISVRSSARPEPTGLMLMCGLASAVLAAAVAWIVTARLHRPLCELRAASEGLTLANLPGPVAEDGPVEIAAVSRSFNLMAQRLHDADTERSLILAGISHDVRTPLAKLKLAFDMMRHEDAELRASAERQIDTIDRILSHFLTFARGFEAEVVTTVEVRQLLTELADTFPDVELLDVTEGTFVCRMEAVRRAVMNLIENGLRYGHAPVTVGIERTDEAWVVTVRDHGAGVPIERIERLKEPFVRGDDARAGVTGTGLGLAIAEKVAKLHGGRLDLRNLSDGFEARLTLR